MDWSKFLSRKLGVGLGSIGGIVYLAQDAMGRAEVDKSLTALTAIGSIAVVSAVYLIAQGSVDRQSQ